MWTLFIVAFLFHIGITAADECTDAVLLSRTTGPFSDVNLAVGWYKVEGKLELADEKVEYGTCGTTLPIWSKDDIPDDDDQTIHNVTACVVSSSNVCSKTYQIRIKNCGRHCVYFLQPTSTGEAYCFQHDDDDDDDDDCEEERHHGKKFHRCSRKHRYFIVVIGIVVICGSLIGIAAIFLWRKRRAALLKKKEAYTVKDPIKQDGGPVVVVTNGGLPEKKY